MRKILKTNTGKAAQCTPSATTFCVTAQGGPNQYLINGYSKPVIQLRAGSTYTFQLVNVATNHPFIITNSTTGGSSSIEHTTGVTGNNVVGTYSCFSPTCSR